MPYPKVLELKRFCCCDLHTGVCGVSLLLVVVWVCYGIGALARTNPDQGILHKTIVKTVSGYLFFGEGGGGLLGP